MSFTESDRSKAIEVKLKNICSRKIYVAINYQDENDDWITRGWWGVDSDGGTSLTNVETTNKNIYFYAYTKDGSKWNGKNKLGSVSKEIAFGKFQSKNNKMIYPLQENRKTVSFFKKESSVNGGVYTVSFSCPN